MVIPFAISSHVYLILHVYPLALHFTQWCNDDVHKLFKLSGYFFELPLFLSVSGKRSRQFFIR